MSDGYNLVLLFSQYLTNVSDIFSSIGRCAFLYLNGVMYHVAEIDQ